MSGSVESRRRRFAEHGVKRVEVSVLASDADLLRRVAKALTDDDQQAERLRRFINGTVPKNKNATVKFKDWLASG
ncbi:MAG TPA: hypothetical protein VHL31_12310 [Geminicoccus sp.]|jgi:5S rRNA maturation endonuclease (ribonuclease M5)|uniref:hypothetical protein n=1 Tax=Geminicoccus sp. TaxID=2024832 RepID=UPI002E37ADCA|nr:hypothetical protein [Geminicoccus sp.]HEX2527064.1 hypothetical protein [Geminicoccus sp.]